MPLWFVLTLLSALLWATSSLVDKWAVTWGFRTSEVLPATYLAGLLVILVGQRPTVEMLQWRHLLSGAGLAFFSLLNAFALLMALRCGDVGMVSAVAGTHCIITAITATVLLGERLSTNQWLALGLAMSGLLLVYGINESLTRNRGHRRKGYRWFWLALLAAIGSSGETIGLKFCTQLSPGAHWSLLWEYLVATVACVGLFYRLSLSFRFEPFLFGLVDGALTGLGMVTFGIALGLGPASLVATVATAAVLFRALGGIIFFGDQARRRQWLGFGLLFLAFILVRMRI